MRVATISRVFVLASFAASALSLQCAGQSASPVAAANPASAAENARSAMAGNYGKLPLSFEANRGQSDRRVKFLSRGNGYGLFLTGNEAVLALHAVEPEGPRSGKNRPAQAKTSVVRMQLLGSNSAAASTGMNALPGTANYFTGRDSSKWETGVPTYSKVRFSAVYPGVDLVYYGNQRQLEYDFVVAPYADPGAIRLRFAGASKLALNSNGDLTVSAADGQIAFQKPAIYQEIHGEHRNVEGHFALLSGHRVSFALGRYDHAQPLVIDPVLVYSTYLGGSGTDSAGAIAVDSAGNAYVAGITSSTDFPVTSGAYQTQNTSGGTTAFVAKLNPSGTALIYATYLNGTYAPYLIPSGNTIGGLAVDDEGNAYLAGSTNSTDFPVTQGAFQTTYGGEPSENFDAFVMKLSPDGTKLIYSTYLSGTDGGNGAGDWGYAIAADNEGNAYVTGLTSSGNFPTTPGAFQRTFKSFGFPPGNAFVTKLNPTGTALVYSTYLGGTDGEDPDWGTSIKVDAAGDAVVGGVAYSYDFPVTPGAYQTRNPGLNGSQVGFVTKFNPAGTALLYSTLLGGSGGYAGNGDQIGSLALDSAGNVYVTGFAYSPDFPITPGAYQTASYGTPYNYSPVGAFVSKLNPTLSTLIYSSCADAANGAIAADTSGDTYIASGQLVMKLNPQGTALLNSESLESGATINAIALDSANQIYAAGQAGPGFPTTPGAFQPTSKNPNGGGFVAKLNMTANSIATRVALTSNNNPSALSSINTFTATVTSVGTSGVPSGNVSFYIYSSPNNATNSFNGLQATVPLSGAGIASYTPKSLPLGTYAVQAVYGGNSNFSVSDSATLLQNVVPAAPTFSPMPGKYVGSVTVTLTSGDIGEPSGDIRYSLDGSDPEYDAIPYYGPFTISSGYVTVKARSVTDLSAPGLLAQATYSIVPQTPAPVFSVSGGARPYGQQIALSDAISGATIRYTTDGSTPTTKSTFYSQPIVLTSSETVRAIAISANDAASNVASATYSVTAAPPTFSPASGRFIGSASIALSDSTPGVTIRYTVDGSTPNTASPVYTGPISLASGYPEIKAIAVSNQYPESTVAEASYTVLAQTPAPVISPAPGSYAVGQTITIMDTAPTATIRYTTDGSMPTTASRLYSGPIMLTGSETIRAIAISTGENSSVVVSSSYTVP